MTDLDAQSAFCLHCPCEGKRTSSRLDLGLVLMSQEAWRASEEGKSQHAKALTALTDGQLQHLVHFFIGVVSREAQLVKTERKKNMEHGTFLG